MKPSFDVLLVEDERVVREAAARILGPEGLSVDRTEDVSGALARLRAADHRIILCDLMLPGFSGFDLLARMASDRPHMPVVVITGYATIENALLAFKKGAFDFLPKPFDVPELLGVARRALACTERHRWNSSMPPRDLAAEAAAGPLRRHFLGQHSWVGIGGPGGDGNGSGVPIGVAESWPGLIAPIEELRLTEPGARVTQGLAFAEIATADGSIHRVWSPLSGTVVSDNPEVRENPDLLNSAPFSSGWLVRIAPADLENELDALTLRAGTPHEPAPAGTEREKSWSS
jgi:CheY-like chemotaxis protein